MAENRISIKFTVIISAVILLITAFYFAAATVFPRRYNEEIAAASAAYGIDENLICAVIWTESKFDESAVSGKGASGLMQMMPETRAEQSRLSGIAADGGALSEIMLGTGYLARMIKLTGDEQIALMAYNAGIGSISRWDEPYAETKEYVRRVNLARNIYKYL